MKKLFFAITALFAFSAINAQTKLEVNTTASKVEWVGKKITGSSHNGTVGIQSGFLTSNGKAVTGGEFVIDMNSIKNIDVENADYNAKLVGHLKSDDFFGVEKFPTAKLVITKVEKLASPTAEANYKITANLTIKGATHPVVFLALISPNGTGFKATASFTVDRSKYDVRYGSESFFDSLGDKAIKNEMEFTVNIVTK